MFTYIIHVFKGYGIKPHRIITSNRHEAWIALKLGNELDIRVIS